MASTGTQQMGGPVLWPAEKADKQVPARRWEVWVVALLLGLFLLSALLVSVPAGR